MRLRKKQALRIVSSVLAASMALSAFPTAAFAAGTPQKTEAENSAVETQAEDSQDNLATLEFDENGLPIGEGNAEEGWTYDDSELTICAGYTFERPEQVVSCAVDNYGVILGGTFKEHVSAISYGILARGVFAEEPSSEQSFVSGMVTVPEGCKINGAISDHAYVIEYPEIVVTVPEGEDANFYNPEVTYGQDYTSIWQHEVVNNTLRFSASSWNNIVVHKYQKVDLVIGEDGKPTSEGNEPSGWSYDGCSLTLYSKYTFDKDVEVNCQVQNYGTITAGVFKQHVNNCRDENNNTKGTISGGVFESVYNTGVVSGGKFDNLSNHDTVENADIGYLDIGDNSAISNSVFGRLSSNSMTPDNVRVLTVSADALVNDIITVEMNGWNEDSNKVYVVGDRDVTVKYAGDSKYFDGWKSEPNVEMKKVDDVTYTFKVPEGGTTLTAKERVVKLTFDENGKPTETGNRTSGWIYETSKDDAGNINWDRLTFYEGYTFDQDVVVNCSVQNGGIIAAGTFTKGVYNSVWDYQAQKDIMGTVTGGVFANLDTETAEAANVYTLSAVGSIINDAILNGAYIAGMNQKVTVTRSADDEDFESWHVVNGTVDIADPTSRTIEFTMPAENVVLGANYKDNALEFDANGNPTHVGGKNWERIYIGEDEYGTKIYGLILKEGAVLDTSGTVKCQIVSYPGSTIKNGVFENDKDSGYQIINFGMIENGTFNSMIVNAGTILDGSFNKSVGNVNIKLDSSQDLSDLGQGIDLTITECPGLISGGTFNAEVANFGIIEGGKFIKTVTSVPFAEYVGDDLESQNIKYDNVTRISDGIFGAEVQNAADITGGRFEKEVINVGTISNGAFWNGVENTTSDNLTSSQMGLNDNIVLMSVFGITDFAVDMQNNADTEKTYTGTITGGAFGEIVTNNGGKITGGVFQNIPEGDTVKNVYTVKAEDSVIGTGAMNFDGGRLTFKNVAYAVGRQEVSVLYIGASEFGSWKTEDVDLSTAVGYRNVIFTVPGDRDVTLTVSSEKPVAQTYVVTVTNGKATVDGNAIEKAKKGDTVTITANAAAEGKEFAGWKVIEGGVTLDDASKTTTTFAMGEEAVTVEATYKDKTTKPTEPTKPDKPSEDTTITVDKDTKLDEDKIYDKDVKNDGIISKGEFTGEVTNNGTIENGTFTDTVTNNGTIKNGKFTGEVKGKGKIEGGTFQQVTEASEISGGVFGAQSDMSNAKVVPSTLKIESSVADSSLVNDVIGNGAAQALALFAENDIATQAADSAEMVAYVVGNQTLTVKYTGTDKSFDKWDTTGLDGAKLSEDGKTITFTMKSGAGDVTLKSVQKKDDTKPTEPTKPEVKTYAVTVKNGKATVDGKAIEKAKKGDVVTITANAAAEGKEFAGWKVIEGGVTLDDESKTTTTFTMGEEAVTVEATYKDKTTAKPTEPTKPTEPDKKDDDGMGALIVGGVIVAGGIATGVIVYNVAMDYIKSALPEGAAIPETREQLAVALWENAGKPEVAVEEGVVLTDTEKAMRWATENKLVSADGADSVSKFDVLVAVYKAKNL